MRIPVSWALPLFLLMCIAASAQTSGPAKAAAPDATRKDISKEGIVVEHYATRAVFEADGSGTREITSVIRVQAEAGVKSLAVLIFPYTSANDTVDVEYVRVRKPDGTVIVTPDYNLQDMPADITRVAPIYSDIHEKHVTVKALSVGDVLEYRVRYRTVKPQVPGQFWFEHTFVKNNIVEDEQLELSVPADREVKLRSPDVAPQFRKDKGRLIYLWKTSNLSREKGDEAGAATLAKGEGLHPSVQLSSFRSWEEVGSWYEELQKPQVAVSPAVRAKAAQITQGLTSDEAKIRSLYDFVSTRVHYISLSFGIGRYQPHAADDVLGNEYGDCKDKHTLLAALLRAAGYEAWPALINASRRIDADLPSPGQFDHLITVVPRGKELVWLDTTPEVAPFGLLLANLRDKEALVMPTGKPASVMKTPQVPPFASSVTFSAEGKLSSDGTLTVHVERSARGDNEVLLRIAFRRVPPAQWKELVQQISYASGFGGEVSNVTASSLDETGQPFRFAYDYTRKNYSDWENRRIMAPAPPFGIEGGKSDKPPSEPLFLGSPGEAVFQGKMELPPGYKPAIPSKVDIANDYAEYHATYGLNEGMFTFERRLIVKKTEVPLTALGEFQKLRQALADEWSHLIDLNARDNKSLAATPSNPEAHRIYDEGYDALQRGDVTTGQEAFRRLLQLDPKFPGAHANLGVSYLMQKNFTAGLEELRKDQEINPQDPFSYRVMAAALAQLHRNSEAIDQLRKLLKVAPNDRNSALVLGQMLMADQKYSDAVGVLETALTQSPGSSSLQLLLGSAYLKDGKKEKGAAALIQAAEAHPDDDSTLNKVAYALVEAGVSLDRAREYSEKVVRRLQVASIKPASSDEDGLARTESLAENWDTLGWVYFRMGDLDKAVPYLRAAWSLTQRSLIGEHLGQGIRASGKSTPSGSPVRASAGWLGRRD